MGDLMLGRVDPASRAARCDRWSTPASTTANWPYTEFYAGRSEALDGVCEDRTAEREEGWRCCTRSPR